MDKIPSSIFFVLGLELIVLTSRRCAVSEIRAPVKTNNNGKIQDLPTIDERLNNRNRTHFISGHVCGREWLQQYCVALLLLSGWFYQLHTAPSFLLVRAIIRQSAVHKHVHDVFSAQHVHSMLIEFRLTVGIACKLQAHCNHPLTADGVRSSEN